MNHRRRTFKALGLSVLATLGLMAFTAAGAQAGGGEWLVLDPSGQVLAIKELNSQLAAVTGALEGMSRLFFLTINLLQKCEKMEIANAHIVPMGHGKAILSFSNCYYTDLSLNKVLACELDGFKLNVLMLLIKHNGSGYLLFSPLTGLTFATLFNLGEECPLPESWSFKGHFVAKMTSPNQHSSKLLITTKETLSLFPNDSINYGTYVVHLELDASMQLAGSHTGLSWGYHLL